MIPGQETLDETLGFARPDSDGDGVDSMTLYEPVENGLGPIAVFPRQAGSEGGVLAIGSVFVDDHYSAGGAGAGIDSHDRNRPHGRRQEQIGKIGLKQFQCFVV